MKDQPIKRGYKVWMLCDSSEYNLKFEIYTGKKEGKIETGLGGRIVLNMYRVGKQKSCCIHGQFFSSNILYEKLLVKKIYACGTVRSN